MTIRTSPPPSQIGQPQTNFRENDFNALIFSKGYDVIVEQAYTCPCSLESNKAQTTCKNCLGTGYVFANPLKTRAIVTSINRNTKYKEWNVENMGTVQLTLRDGVDRVTYYDKITLPESLSQYHENKPLLIDGEGKKFIFTTYPVKNIDSLFLYDGNENPLIRVTEDNYTIRTGSEHIVEIDDSVIPAESNEIVSIRYTHKLQYMVLDLPHDLRQSFKINRNGQEERQDMPVNAIARKVSSIDFGVNNADGSQLIDNTFKS